MADFSFLKNPLTKKWVILAPRRARRPDVSEAQVPVCPFCNNHEKAIYAIPSSKSQITKNVNEADWQVKVVPNKYPFTKTHEIVIHSPVHTKNFEKLPIAHVALILKVYRHRYNEHAHSGQVYIFHNRGRKAGESLPHPHTQITVIPDEVYLDLPPLKSVIQSEEPPVSKKQKHPSDKSQNIDNALETDHFSIFCPEISQWPDEVWVAPKRMGTTFGEITDGEIDDLAHVLFSLITLYDLRYEHDFPFNFYIYPGNNWYLRLIPRKKILGGFEVGTGVIVNTQDPKETMVFIKTHFHQPEVEKLLHDHLADYHKHV